MKGFLRSKKLSLAIVVIAALVSGCTGLGTFHDHARAGDTVAVAAGWSHELKRGNFKVKITDSAGSVTTYAPTEPDYVKVRASVNLYPDPVSSLVVSEQIGQALTPSTLDYSSSINVITGDDADWWETVIFIDLPDPMSLGDAEIEIKDLNIPPNETVISRVTIIPDETGIGTGGTPNSFEAKVGSLPAFFMSDRHFQSLERVPHYEISFSGPTLPHAIQVDLSHDPDEAHGGSGTPYIVNPIGYLKNVSWASTGTNGTDQRVIITPAESGGFTHINDLKFYVAGGITGLLVNGPVEAFDIDGNSIAGISASVTPN